MAVPHSQLKERIGNEALLGWKADESGKGLGRRADGGGISVSICTWEDMYSRRRSVPGSIFDLSPTLT